MTPSRVGIGPEKSKLIEQNRSETQPAIKTDKPLVVVFVSANLTTNDSKLVIHGPKDTASGLLVANGNGSFQTALPTGSYTISAAGIPGASPAKLLGRPLPRVVPERRAAALAQPPCRGDERLHLPSYCGKCGLRRPDWRLTWASGWMARWSSFSQSPFSP